MKSASIAFVHLSDIHFQKSTTLDKYDLDADLRTQLTRDLKTATRDVPKIFGILVTGDVAYSGEESEYKTAEEWLVELSDTLKCQPERVWTVPGNHDVHRDTIEQSLSLQNYHSNLRKTPPAEIDAQLKRHLADVGARKELFLPLANYNDFAAKYGCDTRPDQLYWEYADICLNDGSILKLRGANSALVSDSNDNDTTGKLILGEFQAAIPEEDGVECVLLCHHPPSWLAEQDQIEGWLNARARVQLFGHKHSFKLDKINETVRIAAGATHPSRREPNWIPRYNVIGFSVGTGLEGRELCVEVYPRVWNDTEKAFQADFDREGSPKRVFKVAIKPWEPSGVSARAAAILDAKAHQSTLNGSREGDIGKLMNPARTLTYRFLALSYQVRLEIVQALKLVREEDRAKSDLELRTVYFQRAKSERKLEALWDAVQMATGDSESSENPFRGF